MAGKKGIASYDWDRMVMLVVFLGVVFFAVSVAYGGQSVVDPEPSESRDLHSVPQDRNGPEPAEAVVVVKEKVKVPELRQVAVNLRGATEYETVEIFNKLLNSSPLLQNITRIRLIISPSRPGQCVASWIVMTLEEDTFYIESQLYGFLKNLNAEEGNDILSGLFFQASADDIEIAKKIIPISATLHDLNFGVKYVRAPIVRAPRENREEGLLYAGFD